jgi:HD-like signal output (HDOD) protein
MITAEAYNRIAKKFTDPASLPEMPTATLKVNQLLDADDVSLAVVERTILTDPGLTAALLRTASSAIYGESNQPISTVRAALMRLGIQTVKAVMLSFWTQTLVNQARCRSSFSATRFRDHSMFVGYAARHLFTSKQRLEPFKSKWSADEVFAIGILHDLGTALLAVICPNEFDSIFNQSTIRAVPFSVRFKETYGHELSELGVMAITTWGLDPMFAQAIASMDDPESHPSESTAIACIHWADRTANANKFALFNLPSEPISEFAQAEVGLEPADVPAVISLIQTSMKEPEQQKRRSA